MTDNELLLAISNIVGKNTEYLESRIDTMGQTLNDRIDNVEQRLSNRIDNLDIKIDDVEGRLGHEIRKINLKLENDIEPRLQNIENCYISTYERYKTSVEKIDKMQMDIEIIQDVVKEHGEAIQGLIA